jgi:glycerol kinase
VEHDPDEIWASVVDAVAEACKSAGSGPDDILAVGITNQRETTLLWDRASGVPLHRAIVWQDRRTADRCKTLANEGASQEVRRRTGLVIDPYFSGTKVAWILDEVDGARARAERGEVAFGTVDSYLVWRLCGGAAANAPHVTDVTNASRTLLMNLHSLTWDSDMCAMFRVPASVLPEIRPSAGIFGRIRGVPGLADGTPICGIAGDQHAALFGQACFAVGDVKCTYGTGAFVVLNTGETPRTSEAGLLTTVAWQIGERAVYALEGSSFIAGAAVQWLRDGLKIISASSEVEALARSVESSDGVVFVPALAGLGAPHWDPDARGLLCGLTRGSHAGHIARATLEAIAFQVDDLISAMVTDLGQPLTRIRVDGGAAENDLLMQFQSDVSALTVERPEELQTTARGAAMLAGIGAGLFQSAEEAAQMTAIEKRFESEMTATERQAHQSRWNDALQRAKSKR